jgi:hypothetical protein
MKSQKNSPMVVRFFLVYKVGNAGKERILDREFWVDKLVNAYSLNTVKMLYKDKNYPNKVVSSKMTNFGKVMAIVEAVVLIVPAPAEE